MSLDPARSKQKRAENREGSAELLTQRNINFESLNDGAHLVVRHAGITIDFWPGTGLWITRSPKWRQRGVRQLITYLRQIEESAQ